MELEYRPPRVRRLTVAEWTAAFLPDAPPLPWVGSTGEQIYSFMLVPVPECSHSTTIVYMDAAGKPIEISDGGAMAAMIRALDPVLGEITFLPDSDQLCG